MKVVLAVPWGTRSDDGTRRAAFMKTSEQLSKLFPWFRTEVYDSGHSSFNRAATRNLAVRDNRDADVIVLCDADSIPEQQPLAEAISGATSSGRIHFPFTTVRRLTRAATSRIGRRDLSVLRYYREYPSEGGCWVFSPEVWWNAGGMDERLNGWGNEDRVFLITNHTLVGKPIRHEGLLYVLWHTRHETFEEPDSELHSVYDSLYGDVERMKKYLDKRGSYEFVSA